MIWPLIDLCKVLSYNLFNLCTIFEDFWLPILTVSFDSRHYWVIPLNSKNFVSNLIKFFHLAFSQECTEILYVLSLFENTSYYEFFMVFFDLVPVVVFDRFVSPTIFLLLGLVFQ
jgi:hypothetical protein